MAKQPLILNTIRSESLTKLGDFAIVKGMKVFAPDYYNDFHCLAGACHHTCCQGWEIDIDEDSLPRLLSIPEIAAHVSDDEPAHIRLLEKERCPFLRSDGLCDIILSYGEDMLCDICRDHPRFRNYWTDRVELGLGLVCEAAGKLILSREEPLKLVCLQSDNDNSELPEDEAWLMRYRDELLKSINRAGPEARLLEYLIYRHLPDALYDGLVEERTRFVFSSADEILSKWSQSPGTLDDLVECARQFSYDVEYDDEVLAKRIAES